MGIFCEINLFKPPNEVYRPGQMVSGVIKYSINEPMEVETIRMSLKGVGVIDITNQGSRSNQSYVTTQHYVDVDSIIQGTKIELAIGTYEVRFSYILPYKIPSTMTFDNYVTGVRVRCHIRYYIRIKFQRSGFLAFNKHFRKEVRVISNVIPSLSKEPVIYGESKKLIHLFSSKDSIINIKATIPNSLFPFGGKILMHYEVQNNSHVTIKSIKTKLIQSHMFKSRGYRTLEFEEDVLGTENKIIPTNNERIQKLAIDLTVPQHVYNIQYSMIVKRYYFIRIIAQLPLPHSNVVLDVPVQIGVCDENEDDHRLEQTNRDISYNDPPPTYWDGMGEDKEEEYNNDNKFGSKT